MNSPELPLRTCDHCGREFHTDSPFRPIYCPLCWAAMNKQGFFKDLEQVTEAGDLNCDSNLGEAGE